MEFRVCFGKSILTPNENGYIWSNNEKIFLTVYCYCCFTVKNRRSFKQENFLGNTDQLWSLWSDFNATDGFGN